MSEASEDPRPVTIPPLRLDHILRLSDETGMLEHALGPIPNPRQGYCVDDNARALVVGLRLLNRRGVGVAGGFEERRRLMDLCDRYLSFMLYMQREDGLFHNDIAYDRRYLDEVGSQECFGRAVMALMYSASESYSEAGLEEPETYGTGARDADADYRDEYVEWSMSRRNTSRLMLVRAWPNVAAIDSLRARAHLIIGLSAYITRCNHLQADDGLPVPLREAEHWLGVMADSMVEEYRSVSCKGWRWYEPILTYCNGILPRALFEAYCVTGRRRYLHVAVESMEFIWDALWNGDYLDLVGNRGWYRRNSTKAVFDQQPIDADSMVEAAASAHKATGETWYLEAACESFQWFLGRNRNGVPIYDPSTGGCFDALTPDGVNLNQGAESTLAFFRAWLDLSELDGVELRVADEGDNSARYIEMLNGVREASAASAVSALGSELQGHEQIFATGQ